MCGIAGILAPAGLPNGHLTAMAEALAHRGPDGFGYLTCGGNGECRLHLNSRVPREDEQRGTVGLAHRRLAIFDLSTGSLQPMSDTSGRYWLIYNGEIYNFLELRSELEAQGHVFSTSGDTEVLLRAWEAWGPACLQRFVGMWAFALLDLQEQTLYLCRDRFGIKPLFFTYHRGALYFASEIKGLLAIDTLETMPSEPVVARFLATGSTDDTEETFFSGVRQLPAAHWASVSLIDPGLRVQLHRYWEIPNGAFAGSFTDAVDQTRAMFFDAVNLHARSDVPVGTCLSGGLDSSAIVCTASQLRSAGALNHLTHSAFGYCPSDERQSERLYMETVAEAAGLALNVVEVSNDQLVQYLPEVVRMQDEPFGSASILAQWFVFQRARESGMTVMLDGQGADETLAGYHTYFSSVALGYLRTFRLREYFDVRSRYTAEVGPFPASHRALVQASLPEGLRSSARRIRAQLPSWSSGQYASSGVAMSISPDLLRHDEITSRAAIIEGLPLRERLRANVQQSGLPSLLRFEDRNSMAHSIEARVPFLDHRLVEFLFTLPDDTKIRGVETKYVLRQALRGIVPDPVLMRKDKIGFRADQTWTATYFQDHATDLIASQTPYEAQWFSVKGLQSLLREAVGTGSHEYLLWRILNIKLWLRQHWGNQADTAR